MKVYKYGSTSQLRLDTCHKDIQKIMNEVIKMIDVSIVCGHRTPEEQTALFKKGRNDEGEIVNKGIVVTYKDGSENLSKHNHYPSLAVDVVPYPEQWSSDDKLIYMAGHIMAVAKDMYIRGEIDHVLRWGGDWDQDNDLKDNTFKDLPHFELTKPQ